MKLSHVLDITNLRSLAPFKEYHSKPENEKRYTLKVDKQGIHYWYESEISTFEAFDDKTYQQSIHSYLVREFRIESERTEIYYTIYSLLNAIGDWEYIKDKTFDVEGYIKSNIKSCTQLVAQEIVNNLDFSEIAKMSEVIELVSKDMFLQQMVIYVSAYDYYKHIKGGYRPIDPRNKYTFGNIKFKENLNILRLSVYKDEVEVAYDKERRFNRDIPITTRHGVELTTEDRIRRALYEWRTGGNN